MPGAKKQIIKMIKEMAGKYSPYNIYSDWIETSALRQGMPLTKVSKLLGHESVETTQIYLDISDDELEASHRKYVI